MNKQIVVIEASKVEANYFKDIWKFRELFVFLAIRDILVRYKQTAIGVIWTLIRPLLTMAVFVFVFGKIAGLPSGSLPYPLLVLTGLLPWLFFSNAFTEAANSLIQNKNIISKIYFPRIIIPTSSIIVSFLDFMICGFVLLIMMLYYGIFPTIRLIYLPMFILLMIFTVLGAGLWVAALNVKYRDFGYVVPFITQLGLYISPVAFSSILVPEKWKYIYALNPMVGIINGFRWSLLPNYENIDVYTLIISIIVTTLLLFSGLKYFRSVEKSFADVI